MKRSVQRLVDAIRAAGAADVAFHAAVAMVRAVEERPVARPETIRTLRVPFKVRDEATGVVSLEMRQVVVPVPVATLYRQATTARQVATRRSLRAGVRVQRLAGRMKVEDVREAIAAVVA